MAKEPAPKTRNNPKRAKTRAAIVDAAARLVGEVSYEEMTLEMVANAAGVSRRTIYGHFRNKADLLLAVVDLRWAILPSRRTGEGSMEDYLRGWREGYIATIETRSRRATHAAAMEIYSLKTPEMREKSLALAKRIHDDIEAGFAADFPGAKLPITLTQFVRVLDALTEGLSHRRALFPELFTDDVIEAAVEVLALAARGQVDGT